MKCINNDLQKHYQKRFAISPSNISGWGLFALENISIGSFVMEYVGEILTNEECEDRGAWNDINEVTYMFNVNSNVRY